MTGTQLPTLRDRLHSRLESGVPGLRLNCHPQLRLPNTLHVSFPGVGGRELLAEVAATVAADIDEAADALASAWRRFRGPWRLAVGAPTRPRTPVTSVVLR